MNIIKKIWNWIKKLFIKEIIIDKNIDNDIVDIEKESLEKELNIYKEAHAKLLNEKEIEIDKIKLSIKHSEEIGELGENYVKDILLETFPNDLIEDVKKGAKGCDLIQTIENNKGVIGYEIKNTQTFSNGWIDKFEKDISKNQIVNIGILATKTLPKEMLDNNEQIKKYKNNIWVVDWKVVKPISKTIRQMIISLEENKPDYSNDDILELLNSTEFENNIQRLVSVLSTTKTSFEKHIDKQMKETARFVKEQNKNYTNLETQIEWVIEKICK